MVRRLIISTIASLPTWELFPLIKVMRKLWPRGVQLCSHTFFTKEIGLLDTNTSVTVIARTGHLFYPVCTAPHIKPTLCHVLPAVWRLAHLVTVYFSVSLDICSCSHIFYIKCFNFLKYESKVEPALMHKNFIDTHRLIDNIDDYSDKLGWIHCQRTRLS